MRLLPPTLRLAASAAEPLRTCSEAPSTGFPNFTDLPAGHPTWE